MIKKGSIVLYKNQAALVTDVKDKYLISFLGGSQSVREKDIALLHIGPLSSFSALELNEDLSFQDILTETWELLQDEDAPSFTLSQIAELSIGDFPPQKAWVLFFALSMHPRYNPLPVQNPCEPTFSLRTEEEANLIVARENEKGKEKEVRDAFINRLKQKQLELPEDGVFMGEVESLALGKISISKVMKEAGYSSTPEKAHKLLLDTGVWNYSRNPHPSRFNLSKQSASEHLTHPPEEDRVRVNHVAYAIDNESSTDPDDAIAFDGDFLWVHVADPASTVLPDSPIDIAARDRGATLYLPEGASRMLAEESLTDYALGLVEEISPESLSRALSFKIKLNDDASIGEIEIVKTFVKVERLTYEKADALQKEPFLEPLFIIAEKNIARRKANGAVFIDLPEVSIKVMKTQNDVDVSITTFTQTTSSEVVRECMLLAGEAAARFAFKNNLAFPYVSQEEPDIPKELPEGLAGQYRLRRCMKRRSVGVTPRAHAGLGIAMYSQVTSPLRRYSDLVAHQQLRSFIDGRVPLDKDEMLERISAGDAASSASIKAERKSSLHWTLVYLVQNPDWKGEAIVVELKDKQGVILIPSIAQEALIGIGPNTQLNDTIMVQALDINIPELTVKFASI